MALSFLHTLSKDKTLPEDNLPIIAVNASDDYGTNVDIVYTSSNDIIPLTATAAPSGNSQPTENEFIVRQENDLYCKATSVQAGHPNFEFHSNHRSLLICKSTVHKATQIVVLALLCKRILHLTQHSLVTGHPDHHRMYNTLRREFYGHVWQTTFSIRSPSALAAQKMEADVYLKKTFNSFTPQNRSTSFL